MHFENGTNDCTRQVSQNSSKNSVEDSKPAKTFETQYHSRFAKLKALEVD